MLASKASTSAHLRMQRVGRALASPAPVARPSQRASVINQAAATSEIESLRHITADGWGLELLCQRAQAQAPTKRPPLLCVHGSYHGAWCWAERYMPYFAARGYDVYAVSLRAQGNSDCISNNKDSAVMVAGTLESHAEDLADLVQHVFIDSNRPAPVIIGHSFGGLILMKYVLGIADKPGRPGATDTAKFGAFPQLSGAAYLACVPPSGNKSMIGRFLLKDPILSLKVTWGFVAKSFQGSVDAARELFFSPDIPRADLERYQKQLASCSPVRLIDLGDVNAQTPLPKPPAFAPPAFVLGGEDDKVVDVEAIKELGQYCGVKPIILSKVAHDVMLDTRWEEAAGALEEWLATIKPRS